MENTPITCRHSERGICTRCSLSHTFAISKAEEKRMQGKSSVPANEASSNLPREASPNEEVVRIFPINSQSDDENENTPYSADIRSDIYQPIQIQVLNNQDEGPISVTLPLSEPPNWLMRMFESSLFDAPMAVQYLFMTSEKPVLSYLGKRLLGLPEKELDFFLPQLINMYIHKMDVASTIHAYIEMRCKKCVHFSLLCVWLIERFTNAPPAISFGHSQMLRKMILDEFVNDLKCSSKTSETEFNSLERKISTLSPVHSASHPMLTELDSTKGMPRKNQTTSLSPEKFLDLALHIDSSNRLSHVGGMQSASVMTVQSRFISWLTYIGAKLCDEIGKEAKMVRLKHEIAILNLELPAKCWIPFSNDHFAIRIPPEECCVLNSKDKAPYILYVEVMRGPANQLMNKDSQIISKIKNSVNPDASFTEALDQTGEYLRNLRMRNDPEDPSAAALSEPWMDKKQRIRNGSPYGSLPEWDVIPVIVKTGDDLAQELFAYQLLCTFKQIWEDEGVPLRVRPYKIVVTSPNSGMIEPIIDACSLHQIKRSQVSAIPGKISLLSYFIRMFGQVGRDRFIIAQKKFIESCAAYSLICYFLQLKDRHNGNILIDSEGHLIHIDFGFLLSSSPKNLGFEMSPFKLTTELIEVMGGLDSDMFLYFKSLLLRGLITARKHHERIVTLADIMSTGSNMPCFRLGADTVRALRLRFHISYTDEQLTSLVSDMVESSRDSITTRLYDNFQYYTNGIL
ncbi:unnamed protein product [Caenorhabditis auriculariae]|uniref:Phosphatidylinositol 4-kinase beta n=1 Tax=Caenorhabditis auriculariae TaxID=2777116 RepID=A0A8S1GR81_9PELO|nr:unnamed protein product [Caenorhabditis auriculariae]